MRDDLIAGWLSRGPAASWTRTKLAGDASTRRYERLQAPDRSRSAILMDAPPDLCGPQDAFLRIAAHLQHAGLSAPKVLVEDTTAGLILLEDLGNTDFAQHLRSAPDDEQALYEHAVDVLIHLQEASVPDGLARLTAEVGAQMLDPLFEWFAPDTPHDMQQRIMAEMTRLLEPVTAGSEVLALRDYHAENLIWRPDCAGLARVGLLDFQDAFIAPPVYDLASLLRDARRDVSQATTDAMIARFAAATNQESEALAADFAVIALQRNLRILGIFARLTKRDSKPGYAALIPRVRAHVLSDLSHPVLAGLQSDVQSLLSEHGVGS